MKYHVKINDRKFEISIGNNSAIDGKIPELNIDGHMVAVDFRKLNNNRRYSLVADSRNFEATMEKISGGFNIWHSGGQTFAEVADEKTARFQKLMGSITGSSKLSVLKAPMPGLVLKIEVEPGQHIKKGDGLVIVEAMKMENELKAAASGVVKEIKIKPRQSVEKNQILIIFE
jgi:biotin carboxyl carrier protein